MPKFGSQIDTMLIPTKGFRPEQATAFPGSPVEGQFIHRTDTKTFHIYLNGGWQQCDNQGVAAAVHVHAIADVTGLTAALAGKANATHTHPQSDITNLVSDLAGKAPTSHTHTTAQVTGLDTALAGKVPTTRTISPGTGLWGGGDLTTDRTIAVLFGTGAGKALEGSTTLDQVLAPTADVSMNSKKLTGLADPVSAQDAATKAYVDAAVQGLNVKKSVVVAAASNINLASAPNSIDSVTLTNGMRVLVMGQTTPSQNGVYIFTAAGAAMSRAADADTAAELASAFVFVEKGTYADSGWVQTNELTLLGTDPVTWTQFSGAGQITAGLGLTKTGNSLDVNVDGTSVEVSSDIVRVKDGGITFAKLGTGAVDLTSPKVTGILPNNMGGTGANTAAGARLNLGAASVVSDTGPALTAGAWSANFAHWRNTTAPVVSFIETATGTPIQLDWKVINADNIQLRSDVAFAAGAITITVVGN